MFVLDTNVLVYAVNTAAPEHAACRALVDRCRAQATRWYLTWGILYEFLRVVTHPKVVSRPVTVGQAWSFLGSLLTSPGLALLEHTARHEAVAAQTWQEVPNVSGNLVHDAHTAILMREHGVKRIYTRDTDFHRFPFVEVADPLKVR